MIKEAALIPNFLLHPKSHAHAAVKTKFVFQSHHKLVWFSSLLILINAFLLVSYLLGVNNNAAAGYELKTLQKKAQTLSEDNKKINLKISEAGSMVQIEKDFANSNFITAGTPTFLEVNSYSLSAESPVY